MFGGPTQSYVLSVAVINAKFGARIVSVTTDDSALAVPQLSLHAQYLPERRLELPERPDILLEAGEFLAYRLDEGLYIWQTSATECGGCAGGMELLATNDAGCENFSRIHGDCPCPVMRQARRKAHEQFVIGKDAAAVASCDFDGVFRRAQGAVYSMVMGPELSPSVLRLDQQVLAHTDDLHLE